MDSMTASEIAAREAEVAEEWRARVGAIMDPVAYALLAILYKRAALSLPEPITAKPFT